METLRKPLNLFDGLPTPIKAIIFNGLAGITTLLVADIQTLADDTNKYVAAILLGIVVPLITWATTHYLSEK